jgi:phosphoribosylanthranilate isomerase
MFLEDSKVRIKVCGLTRLDHARFAAGAMVDFLGFIFYPGSARYVSPEDAAEIIGWLEGPTCVGVFVDQPLDEVNSTIRTADLDMVQLHGEETPDYCAGIQGAQIIKSFRVSPEMTTEHLRYLMEPYVRHVDHFLFDTYVDGRYGGTGKTFRWEILKDLTHDFSIIVSGGLHSENISSAVETARPFAVDISSGLELSPGIKDFEKMEAFFEEMERINDSYSNI